MTTRARRVHRAPFSRLVTVALALLPAACGAERQAPSLPLPVPDPTPRLQEADRLVRQGCYACLRDALDIYESLAGSPAAPAARVRAVETATLVAIRERELAMGNGTSLERARMLVGIDPVPYRTAAYLDMAATLPWKSGGVSQEQLDASFGTYRVFVRAWPEWHALTVQDGEAELVRAYLRLSVECGFAGVIAARGGEAPWRPGPAAPPLLRFRAATCEGTDREALESVLRDEPRFAEAHLFLGERAFAEGRLVTAEREMLQAHAAFPTLALATAYLGGIYLAMEDLEESLAFYDATIALVPGLRDALLGKLKCLSYLGRPDEAIRVADRMVGLGTWMLGDAYYWRAWNRQRTGDLDGAWADLERAKTYLPMNGKVALLTGIVAFGRGDAARAEAEFRVAVQYDDRDSDAWFYLGTVLSGRKAWKDAAAAFASAEAGYQAGEDGLRRKVREIEASELGADRKRRLLQAKQRQIEAAALQRARGAYNAAAAWLNLGDAESARPFIERAMAHPDLAEAAARLGERVRRRP